MAWSPPFSAYVRQFFGAKIAMKMAGMVLMGWWARAEWPQMISKIYLAGADSAEVR